VLDRVALTGILFLFSKPALIGKTCLQSWVVVSDGANPTVADTMTIDVYDDACLAAIGKGLAADNPGDFDGNCITGFEDLAVMATKWLVDYALSEPVAKP